MNVGRVRSIAVATLFATLAFPLGLSAHDEQLERPGSPGSPGSNDQREKRHRDDDARRVTILQTTDLHHHANGADHVGFDVNSVTASGLVGSYARIAAYVNAVRASEDHPVVLVDSGDWTMGTLYDLTLGQRPLALYFLEVMGYDCVTLGNHEFDYAPSGLAQILGGAQSAFGFNTPIVASNMDLGGDPDLEPFVGRGKAIERTHIEELSEGLKVGYIGLMGRAAALDAPASAPVSFWDPTAHYADIQEQVDRLRRRGVSIVIALSHSGTDASGASGEDVELAKHVRGINVIASGHTHTPLPSAQTIKNGRWRTYVIDAGYAGSNVSRIDLTYHPSTRTTTLDGSANTSMTDGSLTSIGSVPDPAIASVVDDTDHQINSALGAFFAQTFVDFNPANPATGIYHPVGTTAQDMLSNASSPVPAPNGLGDLAADAVRTVVNAIIAQTLAGVGGNPANAPGYDFAPVQAAVLPTGLLRGALKASSPISFADVYSVLPLGISPDSSQELRLAYPVISIYVDPADVKKVCALQLLVQTNLASSDFYLNVSGLRYTLDSAGSYEYFKFASAASVLALTSLKASAGSTAALEALGALASLATDGGAALLSLYAADNPYAAAMVTLNDTSAAGGQIVDNLAALGQVAAAAAADRTDGTSTLNEIIVSKAVAAIDTVFGFAPDDGPNIGPATPLSGTTRVRTAVDLFTVLALDAVRAQFGVAITAYKSAIGSVVLSGSDLADVLSNRIDAAPASPGIQELKDWMALLSYIGTGLGGTIPSIYASTSNFAQFGTFGLAVQTRNATYPVASIGRLMTTLSGLQSAP